MKRKLQDFINSFLKKKKVIPKYQFNISDIALEKVIFAYSKGTIIHIVYFNRKNEMSLRFVQIVDFDPQNSFIIAYCYYMKAIRIFHLDRIIAPYLEPNFDGEEFDDLDYWITTTNEYKFKALKESIKKRTVLKIRYNDKPKSWIFYEFITPRAYDLILGTVLIYDFIGKREILFELKKILSIETSLFIPSLD
jgi:predicted DNA-binding transcriptional regulator YafY